MHATATVELQPSQSATSATGAQQEKPRIRAAQMLSGDVRARLSSLRPTKVASCLCFDFGLIAVAAITSELTRHPLMYVLAVMIIGARQAGIGSIGIHDGVHRLLSTNRRWNDFLGASLSWIVGTNLLMGFDAYRKHHFDHHRDTNTDDDPDHEFMDKFYAMPRWAAALMILMPLTGAAMVIAWFRYLYRHIRTKPIHCLALVLITGLVAYGYFASSYPVVMFVKYWCIPVATWGIFANQIRALAEHYPEGEFGQGNQTPDTFRTREILNSWFDQIFLVTRGLNFHLTHHLCPQIPFYNLAEMQQELAKSDAYQQYGHVTRGYHRFLWEFFFARTIVRPGIN